MAFIEVAAPATKRGIPAAVMDLSRGRQALLSVAQPALGAVIALGGLPAAGTMALGLTAATAGYLAVFSLNDVLDRRVDARAHALAPSRPSGYDIDTAVDRHPLAAGRLSLRFSLAWVGVLSLLSAVCAWVLSPLCAAALAAAVGLEIAYCALRSVTWLKTFLSGLMVGVGGLAGWIAVGPLSGGSVAFFALLALWEIAGRNVPNDLADVDVDARVGLRTVPTVLGRGTAGRVCLVGAFAVAAAAAAIPVGPAIRISWVVIVIATMLLPALPLWNDPSSERAGRYFNVASLLPALMLASGMSLAALGAPWTP